MKNKNNLILALLMVIGIIVTIGVAFSYHIKLKGYDNSDFVGYTSPNEEVMEELFSEGGTYEGINAYLPRAGYEMDESFHYDEETKKIISNLWSKIKIVASNAGK